MGRKFGIDYRLYRCRIHFSPAFAAKTGFTYYDLNNLLFALVHMFDDDHAAGRHLRLVGLVDFQHQSALGHAPAHKLFTLVQVSAPAHTHSKKVFPSSGSEFPRDLEDHEGMPSSDEYHAMKAGEVKAGKNGEGVAVIKAKRIVWEIPKPTSGRRGQVTPIENPALQSSDAREQLPLSLLNDYLCYPRRAALKIVEGWRSANEHTECGDIVHEHSDLPGYEVAKNVTLLRALPVWSERLACPASATLSRPNSIRPRI